MSIYRTQHNKENPYVCLNKTFLENPELSAKAKGILAYLLSRPDNWQTHTEQLVSVMSDGKTSVSSGLLELEAAGYFKRIRLRDSNYRIISWVTDVFESPIPAEERAVTKEPQAKGGFKYKRRTPQSGFPEVDSLKVENPQSGFPDLGFPEVENRDLISIDLPYQEEINIDLTKGERENLEPEEEKSICANTDPSLPQQDPLVAQKIESHTNGDNPGLDRLPPRADNSPKKENWYKAGRVTDLDAFWEECQTARLQSGARPLQILAKNLLPWQLTVSPNGLDLEFVEWIAKGLRGSVYANGATTGDAKAWLRIATHNFERLEEAIAKWQDYQEKFTPTPAIADAAIAVEEIPDWRYSGMKFHLALVSRYEADPEGFLAENSWHKDWLAEKGNKVIEIRKNQAAQATQVNRFNLDSMIARIA